MIEVRQPNPDSSRDLTRSFWARVFWKLPIVLLIAGGAWQQGGVWLWVVAFTVMGAGCLANAARCGRTHCYVTGPLFVLVAIWCLFSALGMTPSPMHSDTVLLVVVAVVVLAHLAEIPLGRYMKAHR